MDTETFIQAVEDMTPFPRREPFEALMTLALSIEEEDQATQDDEEKSSERGEHTLSPSCSDCARLDPVESPRRRRAQMNKPNEPTNSKQQPSVGQQIVDAETALLEAILESLGTLEADVDLWAREVLVQGSSKFVWFLALAPLW